MQAQRWNEEGEANGGLSKVASVLPILLMSKASLGKASLRQPF